MIGRSRNRRVAEGSRRRSGGSRPPARARALATEPAPPSSPRARRTRRLVLLVVAAALALWPVSLGARKVAHHPALGIRTVKVQGAPHVPAAELLALAAVEPGTPWLLLDTGAVQFRLESHPWVRRARVIRPWPGQVRLSIRECVPVARVEVRGRIYGLCEDLRIVPAADESLPLVRARGRDSADPDALARAVDYLEALRTVDLLPEEPVELEVGTGSEVRTDRLRLPRRGFVAAVDGAVPVSSAVRDVAAFLETLDEEGGSRGTLRLVSSGTGVWRPEGGRIGAG